MELLIISRLASHDLVPLLLDDLLLISRVVVSSSYIEQRGRVQEAPLGVYLRIGIPPPPLPRVNTALIRRVVDAVVAGQWISTNTSNVWAWVNDFVFFWFPQLEIYYSRNKRDTLQGTEQKIRTAKTMMVHSVITIIIVVVGP